MEDEICELCGNSSQNVGTLLDGVCHICNPESHRSELVDELDKLILRGAHYRRISVEALDLWNEVKYDIRTGD